uniref:Putative glycosyltransferase n=1 Tax=viral metagenome TaxID=1070528 RepID=A0A6M3KVE6_9ZZZZ
MKHHLTKILYVQHKTFGDVLIGTAIVRALASKYKNSSIDFYTTAVCAPILFKNPDVGIIYTERRPPVLEDYDIVFRPYRCLQTSGGWHLNNRHWMDLYANICGVSLCRDYRTYFYDIQPITLPHERYVVIQCKTNDRSKDYGRFYEVVKLLNERGLPVIQVGSANDPLIEGVSSRMINFPWSQVAYVIKKAVSTICLDSAIQHLAGAVGAPYIALYGPKGMDLVRSGSVVGSYEEKQFGILPDYDGCKCLTPMCHLAMCHNTDGHCMDTIDPKAIVDLIN